MREILSRLFTRSPFGQLNEHMKKIQECCDLVIPMFDSLVAGDHERVTELAKQTYKLEHEADIIKNTIRDHLPKSIFMPVDRSDVLNFLKEQDAIADAVEDIAVLLTIRTLKVPEQLQAEIKTYIEKSLQACRAAGRITDELSKLMEVGLRGPEAERVLEMINTVGEMEWQADMVQQNLVKRMFTIEKELDPTSILFWMMIFNTIGELANHAENTGDLLRMMISKG